MRDAVREKHREVCDMCQDAAEVEVSTEEFDMVLSQVFNFHSVQSILSANMKTKTNQRTEICEYKTYTGSDGKLMSTRMFKALYL